MTIGKRKRIGTGGLEHVARSLRKARIIGAEVSLSRKAPREIDVDQIGAAASGDPASD
jgi:hypothetical protein